MTKLRVWRCFSVMVTMALILGVAALALPTEPARAQGGTWNIQAVDTIDVTSTSIALDSHGYPHISYTTGEVASLHYASWTGTAWVKEMVDDVPAIVTSLALDSHDLPHIGYTVAGGESLHYAHWTGTAWIKETVDPTSVWDCSLALDSNDRPHIAYATVGLTSLHYTYRTDQGWHTPETVDDINVISTSLALDSNGYPHISYATGGPSSLHYAHWTGTAWITEIVDASDVVSTSIALDSHGYPHISYATATLGAGSLHYASWTGTAWIKETVDPADVLDTSLALDSHDLPHISYAVGIGEPFRSIPDGADNTITNMLKYAHWTGSSWDIQTVDQETVTLDGVPLIGLIGSSKWSSIALDSYDLPHISYGNLVPNIPLTLHYAHFVPPDTSTVNTATGTGTATFHTSAGGIANLTAVGQTAITCAPLGVVFPQGLFSFNIVGLNQGATVTVTITLPSNMPVGTQYWKCQNGAWIDCTSLLGDDNGDNVLTLTLTDGGLGDADGVANGTIIDPGGPVVIVAPAAHQVSPRQPATLKPAQMSVQYLSVTPQQATVNQPVTISTNVVNTGGEAGNLVVALKINGQVEQSQVVSVGPQGTQPVKFTVTKAQPGTYTVDIGGQKGSFTILGASSTATSKSDSVVMIAIVFCVLVIIAVVAVLLARRPA